MHVQVEIIPIDIAHMGPLSDQVAAPFLRSRGIATGTQRQLQQHLVYGNEARTSSRAYS